jgi:hypothetical protein
MDKTATNATAGSARLQNPINPQTGHAERIIPDYPPDEIQYLGRLQSILETARNRWDTNHDQFDGMTFIENPEILHEDWFSRIYPNAGSGSE